MSDDGLRPLSSRLAALRAQTGLSLKQLGRQLHVSDSSLSRYVNAQALPPWDVVEALAALAGTDPQELQATWDAAHRARRRIRPGDSAPTTVVTPVTPAVRTPAVATPDVPAAPVGPLWEPDWSRPAPPPAPSVGRYVAAVVSVVLLMAASSAVAYALSSPTTVDVTAGPPSEPGAPAVPSGEPGGSGAPPSNVRPPAGTPSVQPKPSNPAVVVTRTPSPRTTTAAPVSPAVLVSGTTIAITTEAAGNGAVPYVLDVENWSIDDGARVHLWTWRTDGDYRNQLWVAERVDAATWRMVNKFSSKCLARDDVDALVQALCTGAPEQRWRLGAGGTLRSSTEDRCVEIKGRQRLLDAGLTMSACDGGWYQHWLFTKRGAPNVI